MGTFLMSYQGDIIKEFQQPQKMRFEATSFATPLRNVMMNLIAKGRASAHALTTLLSSSMVEHSAVNRRVVGSNPT